MVELTKKTGIAGSPLNNDPVFYIWLFENKTLITETMKKKKTKYRVDGDSIFQVENNSNL